MTGSQASLKADECIQHHMIASLVAGAIPFPWIGFASLTGVHLNMLRRLAIIYDVEFSTEVARSAIAALVGSDLSVGLSLGLAKLIPGPTVVIGAVSGGLLGAASSFALGKVFVQHFESGNTFLTFDPDKVKAHYQQLFQSTVSESGSDFVGVRP
ncbi:MAG: YcjF family protein [Cyanobium sp.]|jgi:uncharacterized protein (DUF697 family)